jgi:uncharacterized phage protein gp47/JayE
MGNLIVAPVLDSRNEERITAEAIARVTGGLTVERINRNIEIQRQLLALVEGGAVPPAACPELTNANPSSPHTALLEAFTWVVAQQSYNINLLPERDQIEFAALFGIEMTEAVPATATLRFTVNSVTGATVPAGTRVATQGGEYTFATVSQLVVAAGQSTGDVAAACETAGAVLLSPNTLTSIIDPAANVVSATNPDAVDSGADAETLQSALARARNYQRRAERLVSAEDLESAILEEALGGVGLVRAFPLVSDGDWSTTRAGHTTVIVMTPTGQPVSLAARQAITALLAQLVGNQFVHVLDPVYVTFDVTAAVQVKDLTPQAGALAAAERALRDYYAPKAANFGRAVRETNIIRLIEETDGIDHIVPDSPSSILVAPAADIVLAPYQLPKLVNVTLNVV